MQADSARALPLVPNHYNTAPSGASKAELHERKENLQIRGAVHDWALYFLSRALISLGIVRSALLGYDSIYDRNLWACTPAFLVGVVAVVVIFIGFMAIFRGINNGDVHALEKSQNYFNYALACNIISAVLIYIGVVIHEFPRTWHNIVLPDSIMLGLYTPLYFYMTWVAKSTRRQLLDLERDVHAAI
jgi:hypothetical protein